MMLNIYTLLLCSSLTTTILHASQEKAPRWKTLERPEVKETRSSLLTQADSEYGFTLDQESMEKNGHSYVAFQAMTAKEFKNLHRHELPGVSDRVAFESGLIIRLTGVFLASNKEEAFFSPDYQLTREVVEAIGRKVKKEESLPYFQIRAHKTVKSNKIRSSYATGSGEVNSFDLNFTMSAFSWHFHQKAGLRWEGWGGRQDQERFSMESLARLNQRFTEYPGLSVNQGEDFLLNYPDHVVTTRTSPEKGEEIINGSQFVTAVYGIPGKPWSLVVTRWYLSVSQKDLLKRFVGGGLASVVQAFCAVFGPVGVHGFIEQTVLRDYARMVDAVRSFKPDASNGPS